MDAPVLEVKNLTKKFRNFTAVSDISFSIARGEILGFLGPNGAGKTTTINMLLGLLSPTSGQIKILGKDIAHKRREVLEQINFSSSYVRIPWRLTVWENLYTYALLYDIPDPKKRIEEVLAIFEIGDLRNRQAAVLSAGQITRVVLAKAFINKPKLVLLDEPTASLDPDIALKVRQFILRSQNEEKMSILFTSHNMAEVEEVCDRVIFIDQGKIVAEDTPEGLASRITKCQLQLMIVDGMRRTVELARELGYSHKEEGRYITVKLAEEGIAYFLTILAQKGISYQEISIDKPTLEDFFLQMTYEKK